MQRNLGPVNTMVQFVAQFVQGFFELEQVEQGRIEINGEIVSEGSVKIGASSVVIGNITAISAAIATERK